MVVGRTLGGPPWRWRGWNYVLLRLLYAGGLRVEEIARLAWRDLQERGDAGQVTVYGKGGKTRVVLLPAAIWRELLCFRQGADLDAPLFPVPDGLAITTETSCGYMT